MVSQDMKLYTRENPPEKKYKGEKRVGGITHHLPLNRFYPRFINLLAQEITFLWSPISNGFAIVLPCCFEKKKGERNKRGQRILSFFPFPVKCFSVFPELLHSHLAH